MILSFDSHTFDYHIYELHWHPKLAYQFFENNWYHLRVGSLSANRDETGSYLQLLNLCGNKFSCYNVFTFYMPVNKVITSTTLFLQVYKIIFFFIHRTPYLVNSPTRS